MTSFEGKVVMVTGASEGIGAGIAKLFAQQGATLSVVARNAKLLEENATEWTNLSPSKTEPLVTVGDLTDFAVQKAFVDNTLTQFGRIDVLVNNAGRVVRETLLDNEPDDFRGFDEQVNLNLRVPFGLTRLVAPHLIKTKGSIINMSSIAGRLQASTFITYGMTKAALDYMTTASAAELATHGVRVNAVVPGFVPTNIIKDSVGDKSKEFITAGASLYHANGKPVTIEGVAEACVFLASDRAQFITGSSIVIDNGAVAKFSQSGQILETSIGHN